MAQKKKLILTPETIDEWQRTKRLENIEYRVVCSKDIITGEEAINIVQSKDTSHDEIMFEVMARNPRARDMAGRVLLYDTGSEPIVVFDALKFPSMLTAYWEWDKRVIPHLEPKIKQTFKEMKAEGKTATIHIDHSKDQDDDYWDKVFDRMDKMDKQFAGRDLMKRIEDYAPKNPQEEKIKERSLHRMKYEHDVEQAEAVRARQDATHDRAKVFLWKQAGRDGD